MKPCSQCFENIWEFQKIENTIRATCQSCGYEVEFTAQSSHDVENPGDKCRHCLGKVVLIETKPKSKFTGFLKCDKCGKQYWKSKYRRDYGKGVELSVL